jgi:hypothetical protein
MVQKNQVYQCHNNACSPYHFKSSVLLDVLVGDQRYSINSSLTTFQYFNGDDAIPMTEAGDTLSFVAAPEAKCYHCKGPTKVVEVPLNSEADRTEALKRLDHCEQLVAKLLERFK